MSGIDINFLGSQNLSDITLKYPGSKREITKEWFSTPPQKYTGEILHGNIHGHGFYFIEKEDKTFYDGLFYANKLEGYSQVFYNDGSNFQGIFKDNIRFGPGVLTYPNGEQDVGLWMGQNLIRLGGVNDRNLVPRLATTPVGQLKLLKYRYLVPVCPKRVDIAHETLKRLGANERVLQNSHKLYNAEISNKGNIFFNKKLFDSQFYPDQDCSIDIVATDEEEDLVDDKKTELQEEPGTSSLLDINVERVRQLSQQMEITEDYLHAVTEKRAVVERNVKHCKACCRYEFEDRKSSQSTLHEEDEKKESDEDFTMRRLPSVRIDDAVKIETYSAITDDVFSTIYSEDQHSFSVYEDDVLVESDTSNVTAQIKDYLMDTCICDEAMGIEDLYELEKELESLKKDEIFFECILKNLKEKLEMHVKRSEGVNSVKTKKISVKDVLAWNNEELCMRMLKHGFRHRNSEYMVNFNVSDLIAGNREEFGELGLQERECRKFLNACNDGDTETILKLIKENCINVNVSDAKGNNGMFLASVNREIETMRLLVNLGAKLDVVNDEGLLPLSMCLLIYLAEKYNIYDWEKSFLPETVEPMIEQKDAYKWYQNMSLNVLARHGRTTHSFIEEVKFKASDMSFLPVKEADAYFFKVNCPVVKSEEVRKSVVYNPKVNVSYTRTRSIDESIKTLLACGANPNAGEAPLPPLFLSLFTENINLVECVLGANADTNTTIDEEMTPLHVVASLKCTQINADICSLLIEYDCDPRLKTTADHWPDQKEFILGKNVNPSEIEDFGKNPLHIICIRRDFTLDRCYYFHQMAMLLADSRIDCNEKYLGHTPLSLAVLIGNQSLVETLMKLHVIDPHQNLDHNMGNVLTIYILKRYEDQIPPNAKNILTSLVNLGANPLISVDQFEKTIAFMENEHAVQSVKSNKARIHDFGRAPKAHEGISQNMLKYHIIELARKTIIKYVQLYAVQNLYNLMEEKLTHHRCAIILAEFLTPDIIILNLQYLFKYGKIKADRFDKNICLKVIDTVNENQVIYRRRDQKDLKEEIRDKGRKELKKSSKNKMESKESKTNTKKTGIQNKSKKEPTPGTKRPPRDANVPSVYINTSDYGHILDMTNFDQIEKKKFSFKLPHPGLDNTAKYKVCFHCLTKRNKTLMLCPRCQLIYFCSEKCNIANLKLNTKHVCNLIFYATELTRLESPTAPGLVHQENHSDFYARLEESCEIRLKQRLDYENEQIRIQFAEQRKSDTYGTKWVRWMREQKMKVKRTPTNATLLGSVGDLARLESDMVSVEKRDSNDSIARRTFSGSDKHAPVRMESPTNQDVAAKYKIVAKQRHYSGKKHDDKCDCEECTMHEKAGKKTACRCKRDSKETLRKIKTMEDAHTSDETSAIAGTMRTIPKRYETFIGLLTKYFPDVDFSTLFLPYTCYSNGHLYYKFSKEELDKRTYSMM